jgi:acyl-homoserine lactone acylase PvdQ
MDRRRAARLTSAFTVAFLALTLNGPTPAGAEPPVTAAAPGATPGNLDYCLAQCLNILPPGQNGNATFAELLAHKAFGTRPGHAADQKAKYESLVWNYQSLTNDSLQRFFNPSSFGAPAGGVESTYSPRSDVTIYRERVSGVPHVRGTTRAGTMFGAGYASAQDRLFVMDALRHVGRGELTPFAGGSPGNRSFEQDQWITAPYTEADLQRQFDQGDDLYGDAGRRSQQDVLAYVAGINQYLADIRAGSRNLPGEYTALGRNAVEEWKVTDVIATASLVGGVFGKGGGGEVRSALALLEAQHRYGPELGRQIWEVFRAADDPEANSTVHNGAEFPYGESPATASGRVLPERGTVVAEPYVTEPTGSAGLRAALPEGLHGLAQTPTRAMSNALVVSGRESESGHPLAVFGPQAGYFAPQLLLELDLQGPGISSHGAAFAGVSMYVLLGRGQDYAWSATSAGQDIADTFAVELCEPGGAAPTLKSMHYRFRGECLPIEVLRKRNEWKPSLADSTPAGGYTLVAQRTKLGIVRHRGLADGKPAVFTVLRSTYFHEADSGIGFSMFNDPARITSAQAFQRAAHDVGYTFNWLYVDADDTAYFNSGANPVRAPDTDPNFPTRAEQRYEWRGWNPDTNMADYTPFEQHPQGINQDYYTSWNNKQAPKFRAADDQYGFGPIYRNKPLDDRIRAGIAGDATMSKVELVQAMEDAGTVDLRGDAVLPFALEVIGDGPTGDPAVDAAAAKLRAWVASGAHRIARKDPNQTKVYRYDEADAVQLMDAWWPRWVKAEFSGLGEPLYTALTNVLPVDDRVGHVGSKFQFGWYGYASKDLRAILGRSVSGGFPTPFCGGGDRAACRQLLIDTLKQATAVPAAELYPADGDCGAGDQFCADQIIHQPLGGITQEKTQWVNRPTYQQVIEFPARRGDTIANLARGKTATATSTEGGYVAANAVDGDPDTRWASRWWHDPESITVDLGSQQTVARVVADWEAAYAKDYTVQVSTDGAAWREVKRVTGGDGGRDNWTFPATSARYVRIVGTVRGINYGYSLYEFAVYPR